MQENRIPTDNNEPLDPNNVKKGNQLIARQQVDESPLEIITVEEKGSAVVMGLNRISDWYATIEEVEYYMETWDFKIKLIGTILEKWDNFKESENK